MDLCCYAIGALAPKKTVRPSRLGARDNSGWSLALQPAGLRGPIEHVKQKHAREIFSLHQSQESNKFLGGDGASLGHVTLVSGQQLTIKLGFFVAQEVWRSRRGEALVVEPTKSSSKQFLI
jgi:hypothetical protein